MATESTKSRARRRAENRGRQLHDELARVSNDPLGRVAAACDYLRAAMAVSSVEEQTVVADEMVPVIVDRGHRLMQWRITE